MKSNIEIIKKIPSPSQPFIKKVYQKPVLKLLGDVRSVTLGGSPGVGEGQGANMRFMRNP